MTTAAIILAAGRGTRAGAGLPKQWRALAGRPVIAHALEAFAGLFRVLVIHPEDAAAQGIADGDVVQLGNVRGDIRLHAKISDGVKPGVLIAEGIWPNSAHLDGDGINVLTGADPVAPYGGAAFHDNRVWLRKSV